MATYRLRDAHSKLQPDGFRNATGYSADIQATTDKLLTAPDDDALEKELAEWLTQNQPCIFGKLAAARGLNSYCFLVEDDLHRSDEEIQKKIQAARLQWKSLAGQSGKSAFIILAISRSLAGAAPDENLKQFTTGLASLYLKKSVLPDKIYTDTIRLLNLRRTECRQWGVGVNVFAIQGDQRWWNDHRIPGGVGFSMNSVGHLVASEALRSALVDAKEQLSGDAGPVKRIRQLKRLEAEIANLSQTSIQSLDHALKYAMHTINSASHREEVGKCQWQKATSLLREGPDFPCPIDLISSDPKLNGMNWTTYIGWYHTDVTIPSEYFLPHQEKPATIITPFALDFSYLHAHHESDYKKLGRGEIVRSLSRSGKAK